MIALFTNSRNARRALLLALALLCLGGCRMPPVNDPHSPYFTVPAGSRFILHEQLVVPAGKWSVYFQQGKALSFGGIDEYLPYCELQVTGPAQQPQIIEPGEFLIVRVREGISGVQPGVTTVAFGGARLTGVFEKEVASYETVMDLRADTHPEITRVRCARVDEVPVGVFLSLAQIHAALGEIATIEISGPAMQHDER